MCGPRRAPIGRSLTTILPYAPLELYLMLFFGSVLSSCDLSKFNLSKFAVLIYVLPN
jgi:hypothetical protein